MREAAPKTDPPPYLMVVQVEARSGRASNQGFAVSFAQQLAFVATQYSGSVGRGSVKMSISPHDARLAIPLAN